MLILLDKAPVWNFIWINVYSSDHSRSRKMNFYVNRRIERC